MLSNEQKNVHDSIIDWVKCKNYTYNKNYITCGGYAGTGKTFLITQLRKTIYENWRRLRVAFVTFTGKASSVLKQKLLENNSIYDYDYCGTIHSLLYRPKYIYSKILKKMVIYKWEKIETLDYDIIIIDEASMVSGVIWKDIISYNKPVIAIGDHGQLPPIEGSFSLLKNLDLELKNIHRQSLNSPIINLSSFVRKYGYIPSNRIFSKDVFKVSWKSNICQKKWNNINFDENIIVLCGFNNSRVKINNIIRKKLDFIRDEPYPSERIICLRNNYNSKIMNGQIGTLIWLMPHSKIMNRMTIQMDGVGEIYDGIVSKEGFGKTFYDDLYNIDNKKKKDIKKNIKDSEFASLDYFDFGYCISVHRSQGSEWQKVVVFEQRSKYWDDVYYAKWLYTSITRAREKLMIISDF